MTTVTDTHIRRNTSAEPAEDMIRDAALVLDAAGVVRSRSWVSRTVRDYLESSMTGLPFGLYLAARVDMNIHQRRLLAERADLRYLLTYADPTGETAARNVDRERAR